MGRQQRGQAVGNIFGVHGLQVEGAADGQGQNAQAGEFDKQLAAGAAAPVHHRRAGDGSVDVFGHGIVAASFAGEKGGEMGGVGAECGELHPAAHAGFLRPGGQQGGRAVVDGFQNAGMAAHHADAVHHRIAARQQRFGGILAQAQQIQFGMRRRAHGVACVAQAAGGAAADKAVGAEQQDIHGASLCLGMGRLKGGWASFRLPTPGCVGIRLAKQFFE